MSSQQGVEKITPLAAPSTTAPFKSNVRIYYEDTDAQGVVYYANYLKFMERCRTDWLRHIGCDIDVVNRRYGIIFAVRSTHVDYFKPARLSDLLTVTVGILELRRASTNLRANRISQYNLTAVIGGRNKVHSTCLSGWSFQVRKSGKLRPWLIRSVKSGGFPLPGATCSLQSTGCLTGKITQPIRS